MSGYGYRFIGGAERWRGVPGRDLSQDEFEALGPLEQRTVTEGGGYQAITAKEAKEAAKAEAEARKAEEARIEAEEAAREAEEAAQLKAEADAQAEAGTGDE
jgi:membrane protein involved in colicin uptake